MCDAHTRFLVGAPLSSRQRVFRASSTLKAGFSRTWRRVFSHGLLSLRIFTLLAGLPATHLGGGGWALFDCCPTVCLVILRDFPCRFRSPSGYNDAHMSTFQKYNLTLSDELVHWKVTFPSGLSWIWAPKKHNLQTWDTFSQRVLTAHIRAIKNRKKWSDFCWVDRITTNDRVHLGYDVIERGRLNRYCDTIELRDS